MKIMNRAAIAVVLSLTAPSSASAQSVDPIGHQCVVKPSMIVDVGSAVQGVLKSVKVDRGDLVKVGSVLAELESSIQGADYELAKIRAAFEDRRAGRMNVLAKGNMASPQERDETETKRLIADGEMKRAAAELARRSILSPINGVVVERNNDPGEFVKDSRLIRLAQIDPLTIEALLPAKLFPQVQKGMQADVELFEPAAGRYTATITAVDRIIDSASGTFGVQISLPNPDNLVPAGIVCNLRLSIREASGKSQ